MAWASDWYCALWHLTGLPSYYVDILQEGDPEREKGVPIQHRHSHAPTVLRPMALRPILLAHGGVVAHAD